MTAFYPHKAANELTTVLRMVGVAVFPVDVRTIALEISRQKFPDDPIIEIKGDRLPGFEGALTSAPPGKKGWGILYNSAVTSRGRINFTLGHEFGHYLLHREAYPGGFFCSTEDMNRWESEYAQRENEANAFASTLLMPFDDFRAQIDARVQPDFDLLGLCAGRYDVSLMAATLKWLQYTSCRSMLVVSCDGFILWARSSKPALKSGLYFKTRDRPPIEIPRNALAADRKALKGTSRVRELADDAWFNEACTEQVILSEQYDFTLSLLHFATDNGYNSEDLEESIDDVSGRLRNHAYAD